MDRRRFLLTSLAGAFAVPLAAGAQKGDKVRRIGFLGIVPPPIFETTVFDYVRRSMPYLQPHSLSDNEVYAVTAYLLNVNGIIGENDEMNAQTLPRVKMPNQSNFIFVYPSRGK